MLVKLFDKNIDKELLVNYMESVDSDFGTPLSQKVNLESYCSKLLKYGMVYGIVENNQIVALTGFYCNDTVTMTAHLPLLSTKEAARGKGCAKTLMKKTLSVCRKYGMKRIYCDSVNPIAVKLYTSLGFKEYKQETLDGAVKKYLEYIL